MKFEIKTLVDVTETNARKTPGDRLPYNQQQNYLTMLQTMCLRVNVEVCQSPKIEIEETNSFGSRYKGKQRVWTTLINIEYQDALTVDMLKEDFDLVPVIINLTESAKINTSVFRTRDSKDKNIIFKLVDN
jgi:hypothetical protein